MRTAILAGALLMCWCVCAAQDFAEDFETGPGGMQSYHKAPDELAIQRLEGDAASGRFYVRTELPGKKGLEGFHLSALGMTGPGLVTVTARVRGRGEMLFCLISGSNWLYAPRDLTLTDQWQEVSLPKVLMSRDRSVGIHFLSRTLQPGAVFELDQVRATQAPALETLDAGVGPWRIEAEDFAGRPATVGPDPGAPEVRALISDSYLIAADLPFPRTSRPVTVYARARFGDDKDALRLVSNRGGMSQQVQTVSGQASADWRWLKFPPAFADEFGESFGVVSVRPKSARGEIALDRVVIDTEDGLDDAQLDSAPALFGDKPLCQVRRAREAPVVDGHGGDDCWGQAVICGGFIGLGPGPDAAEPTSAGFCYDDENLYMLAECSESLLVTASQRRHEFKATIDKRDGEVYSDDSVLLLLDPARDGKRVYDLTVNALGTIADAVGTAPDLWESRSLAWDSGALAAGKVDEGRWFVELAIPFADLGGAPRPGDRWDVSLGRIARSRKETSTWNPCGPGVHAPVSMGTLVFADSAPGMMAEAPKALQLGPNRFSVGLADPASGPFTLFTHLRFPSQGLCRWEVFPTGNDELIQEFSVTTDAEAKMACGVLDAATLEPVYLTPSLPRPVKSSVADLRVATGGPWELILNGARVGGGRGGEEAAVTVPLRKGANVLALQVESGTAAVAGKVGDFTFDASGWKMAPAGVANPVAADTDDSAWATAPRTDTHPELGPVVGEVGKPGILRLTLLYERTRVWPTPEPEYCLAQGISQHITFVAEGLKRRKLDGWRTMLAVPPQFEVLGSTGFYGVRPEIPRYSCVQLGEQEIQGSRMRVAEISADQPLLPDRHHIMSEFEAFVRVRPDAGQIPSQARFVYWSSANDGSVIEPPQVIKVRVLPQVSGAQCKTLVWQLWGSWLSNMDDLGMREQVLECAARAGFNDIVSGDRWTSDNAPRNGLRHTHCINFEPWALGLGEYLREHPGDRLLDVEGKPSDKYMCMTVLLDAGWEQARLRLAEKIDQVGADTLDYDYEFSPYGGPHSCYCPRCLAAFGEFLGTPGTHPRPETIRADHSQQWVDFMAGRVARLMRRFRDTIHELAPGTHFSIYSGYQTPDNPERYGIDWRLIGDLQACDHAGCGYGRPVEAIAETIQALKGIPLTCGACLHPYERSVLTPVSPLTRAWLLRTVLDSTGGVLVYERTGMDGRSWIAAGDVTRLVAEHETAFLEGVRESLPGQDAAQVQVLRHGDLTLLCLMNPQSKPLQVALDLPAEFGAGREFYSGRGVAAGEKLQATLEPGDAQVLVLKR